MPRNWTIERKRDVKKTKDEQKFAAYTKKTAAYTIKNQIICSKKFLLEQLGNRRRTYS